MTIIRLLDLVLVVVIKSLLKSQKNCPNPKKLLKNWNLSQNNTIKEFKFFIFNKKIAFNYL